MDETLFVRGIKRVRDLVNKPCRPHGFKRTIFIDHGCQIPARNQPHRDEQQTFLLADPKDRDDMRMLDRGSDLRLTHEPIAEVTVRREFGRDDLDRDRALRLGL
jgi:hypothetical protein